jgi:FkbM family methyltransferase
LSEKERLLDLNGILRPERLTEIVDVGANPIDGDPPYKAMLRAGLCRVTGFEPQPDAFRRLGEMAGPNENYLPIALGDGTDQTLHLCRAQGMTSFYKPDQASLASFNGFSDFGAVIGEMPLRGHRLDDVSQIARMDFLKIDVQGAELTIIANALNKLAETVALQLEVSFVALYEQQPTIGALDEALREIGLIPHCLVALKRWPISPAAINGNSRTPLNQLLEADLVYVRDFRRFESMTSEQWKHLALIAHHCYGSFDLALRAVTLLAEAGIVAADGPELYIQDLRNTAGIDIRST